MQYTQFAKLLLNILWTDKIFQLSRPFNSMFRSQWERTKKKKNDIFSAQWDYSGFYFESKSNKTNFFQFNAESS